jgi:hypothetical protein
MIEYGIWSDASGGFIETQLWSEEQAKARIAELGDEAPEDAQVLEICAEHEEQPARSCEECAAEEDCCGNCGDPDCDGITCELDEYEEA